METATITESGGSQVIHLPAGFRIAAPVVNVWRDGDRIVMEPTAAMDWPKGYFDSFHVTDPNYGRLEQPPMSPIEESVGGGHH